MKQLIRALLCICLSLALISGLCGCAIYGQRKVADQGYLEARKDALSIRRPDASDDFTVFAAVVDVDCGDHVETLICHVDGLLHLYLSTGEGYLNVQEKDPALSIATQELLRGLGARLDSTLWQSKTDLALPSVGQDSIYLLTDKGIHLLTVTPDLITEASREVQEIYALYTALYEQAKLSISVST